MAIKKIGESLIFTFRFMQFSGLNQTGLPGTSNVFRDNILLVASTDLIQDTTDNTLYYIVINGSSVVDSGSYKATATVADSTAANTVASRTVDSLDIYDVQPSAVTDIVTNKTNILSIKTTAESTQTTVNTINSSLASYLAQAVTDADLEAAANEIIVLIESLPDNTASLQTIENLATQILEAVNAMSVSVNAQYADMVARVSALPVSTRQEIDSNSTVLSNINSYTERIPTNVATNDNITTAQTSINNNIDDVQNTVNTLTGITITPPSEDLPIVDDYTVKAGDTVSRPYTATNMPTGEYTWRFTIKPVTKDYPLTLGTAVIKQTIIPTVDDVFNINYTAPNAGVYKWDIEGVGEETSVVKTLAEGTIICELDVTQMGDRS